MDGSRLKFLVLAVGLFAWQSNGFADETPQHGATLAAPVVTGQEKHDAKDGHGAPADKHDAGDGKHDEHHDEAHEHEHEHHHEEPSDVLLRDLFTTGWFDKFEERERENRAPRFNLFKTRQGFLERVLNFNYAFLYRSDAGRFDEHEASVGIEYALSRRFEVELEPIYLWRNSRGAAASQSGMRWDIGTHFQLIDTADTAINFQVRVITPNSQIEEPQTAMQFTLAGWNDLTKCGLKRVGLYYHIEYEVLFGPRGVESEELDVPPEFRASNRTTYSVALAKTLVDPTVPLIGDFTVFLEAYGATELDGTNVGRTYYSFTPGMRMNLAGREERGWWLQTGVEVPVAGPRGYDMGVRLQLTHDF